MSFRDEHVARLADAEREFSSSPPAASRRKAAAVLQAAFRNASPDEMCAFFLGKILESAGDDLAPEETGEFMAEAGQLAASMAEDARRRFG